MSSDADIPWLDIHALVAQIAERLGGNEGCIMSSLAVVPYYVKKQNVDFSIVYSSNTKKTFIS